MTITAAADGSSLGNPGPAGWCWFIDDTTWAAGGWKSGTNNRGELMAVAELLNATSHRADEDLHVLCDSQYVINSVTKWMPGWKRKGWRKRDGKPVLNVDILKLIDEQMSGRSVTFEWVKGHSGHGLNEAADERARAVATAYQRGSAPQHGPGFPGAGAPLPGSDDSIPADSVSAPSSFSAQSKGAGLGDDGVQDGLFDVAEDVVKQKSVAMSARILQKTLLRAVARAHGGDEKRLEYLAKNAVLVPTGLSNAFPEWLGHESLVDGAKVAESGTTAVVVIDSDLATATSTWDLSGDGVLVAHHVA
ncbi:ribonuclease H family protein [Corynebacterium sp. H113]|uniref:ribonuclease H family protein n=1 Tax=Corynebacterium sp. H113 TaxID=3133419 RepID=UPI0030A81211